MSLFLRTHANGHSARQFSRRAYLACVLAPFAAVSCGAPSSPPDAAPAHAVYRNEVRFGLTFEERMAVAAEVSRLRGAANERADELHDPFRSRENAIRNEEASSQLFEESKAALLAERQLTDEQLEDILREYQASLGANLR